MSIRGRCGFSSPASTLPGGQRQAGGPPRGYLGLWLRPLRDADGKEGVPGRYGNRDARSGAEE